MKTALRHFAAAGLALAFSLPAYSQVIGPAPGSGNGGSLTVPSTITGSISGSATTGAIGYGTLGYSDTNNFGAFQTSVNSYAQFVLQNTNAGATASADYIVSNNLGTASTYYGNFGINSSGFTGTGALNQASAVYLTSTSGDLSIGTTTNNAIHFVVNSGATDTATISTAGVSIASGQPLNWNSDSGISRLGAASLAIGNGTAGDFSGALKLGALTATGASSFSASVRFDNDKVAVGYTLDGIQFVSTGGLAWSNSAASSLAGSLDLFLTRAAAASLQLGAAANGTPVANTLTIGESATGTNIVGANGTIRPGDGTGSGGSGTLTIALASPGSTGTSANTYVPAFVFSPGTTNSLTAIQSRFDAYEDYESSGSIYSRAYFDAGKTTAGVFAIGSEHAGTTTSGTNLTKFGIYNDGTLILDYGITAGSSFSAHASYNNFYGSITYGTSLTATLGVSSNTVAAVDTNGSYTNWRVGNTNIGLVTTKPTIVNSLPSASTVGAGARASVTDATACVFGAAPTGGGSTYCNVTSNGTSWIEG